MTMQASSFLSDLYWCSLWTLALLWVKYAHTCWFLRLLSSVIYIYKLWFLSFIMVFSVHYCCTWKKYSTYSFSKAKTVLFLLQYGSVDRITAASPDSSITSQVTQDIWDSACSIIVSEGDINMGEENQPAGEEKSSWLSYQYGIWESYSGLSTCHERQQEQHGTGGFGTSGPFDVSWQLAHHAYVKTKQMTLLWPPTFHNSLIHSSTVYTTDCSLENGKAFQPALTGITLTSGKLEGEGSGLYPSRIEAIG